ncbi:phosphatase PAP2 family protein [Algicola sagamiensis]|uniref:phosphatase PAP2 family protein n=1 Tax=Algicola sagamiensis TaxID=163869 RepID=UPI000360F0B9|nr:phosphatase PAP2 family protein [Algicola sagamiensis]
MAFERAKHIDTSLFFYMFSKSWTPAVCRFFYWVSKIGDGYCYLLIGVFAFGIAGEEGQMFFLLTLFAFAVELPLYFILKQTFKRDRPLSQSVEVRAHIVPSDQFSLPSGHTAAACLMATMISAYFVTFAVIAWVFAILIGIARVVLGVHYPSDVFVGALLGCGSALFVLLTVAS